MAIKAPRQVLPEDIEKLLSSTLGKPGAAAALLGWLNARKDKYVEESSTLARRALFNEQYRNEAVLREGAIKEVDSLISIVEGFGK